MLTFPQRLLVNELIFHNRPNDIAVITHFHGQLMQKYPPSKKKKKKKRKEKQIVLFNMTNR